MDKFLLWSWIGAALAAVGVGLLIWWRRPATTQEEDKDRLRTEYFRQKRETKQLRGPEIDDQLDFCGPCQYLRLRHASSLARLLLLLANFGKEGRPEPIVGKFSQETLAEMIGTTRSRVSFFMNKFRKLGFIEYNGKLEVHNSLLNVVLHDKPEIKTRDEAISAA
jgi:Crp-like helix-turn-helix domain